GARPGGVAPQGASAMSHLSGRLFLQAAGGTAAALALPGVPLLAAEEQPAFTLPKLPYAFDALEPHIDKQTMEIHHDRHHQAYVDNLNKALAAHPDLLKKPIEVILRDHEKAVPKDIQPAVRNNGGGHFNHTLFWEVMGPKGGGEPGGALGKAIADHWKSFDKFQAEMAQAGMTRFGSGWAWLVVDKGKLMVRNSANQDCPLMD